ncbi:MAG TPA: glycine cleavage system aminomethyltransferase GcvT [Humisphaera sp.]
MLKRTPFHEFHVAAGARLVDFAGWEMPIVYRSIVDEHEQTRKSGSLFDVSHMGRLEFRGPDAARFLDHVLTRNVSAMKVGQSRYSLVCNAAGGVLDDIIVSKDLKRWLMVCNASNRAKLVDYFHHVRHDGKFDFDMADETESTAMVALQGPKVIDKIADVLPVDVRGLKRYTFAAEELLMTPIVVFRSGYTGEDGVEVVIPAKAAAMAVKLLTGSLEKAEATIKPAGLGARDTLRLEAAMPLYGHELNEQWDPLSAGLGWAVDLTKEFVGVEALRQVQKDGPKRKLVGLELEGRRIARQGAQVLAAEGGAAVGEVTSGTFSPTLQKSIALAYVDANLSAVGTQLSVDLKGTGNPAKIVPLPFYKRS